MKLFYIVVITASLCITSMYAQTDAVSTINYSFSKASVTARNYDTKAVVFSHIFGDTTSLRELNELSYPLQPVFLRAEIQEGILIACELWNNHKEYSVQEEGGLLIPTKQIEGAPASDEFDPLPQPYALLPNYKLEIEGSTATFTFTVRYGNEMYDFPLESKFVIVLTKDELK